MADCKIYDDIPHIECFAYANLTQPRILVSISFLRIAYTNTVFTPFLPSLSPSNSF